MDNDDLDRNEDLTPADGPDDDLPVDDPGHPPRFDRTRPSGARIGISVPGAVAAVLLIGTLAFGADAGLVGADRDATSEAASAPAEAADVEKETESTPAPDDGQADDPEPTHTATAEPTRQPDATAAPTDKAVETPRPTERPDGTPKPTERPVEKPKPTSEPTPKPTERPVLDLGLEIKEDGVRITWSACHVDGADVYKVVRSSDKTVRWPAGEGDTVVAGVKLGADRVVWDGSAPAGKTVWYRVFCVRLAESGSSVVAASPSRSIDTAERTPEPTAKPTPKPTPEVSDLAIEAGVDGGVVIIHWQICARDGFSHYRILRKTDGEPSLLAEIGDKAATTYVDDSVEPGVEYHYLVQCKGHVGDSWPLLGSTGWVAATVD